ncbi:MAG: hypothetical protein VX892_01455 [Candidatus Thermoplasmatota archaeon]|nr:hypothetical protein [Candidatus Thermoplasmatota archaeon]MED5375154.1 hypothetical protein [Candidatus Thermoplasmatota archaeon]
MPRLIAIILGSFSAYYLWTLWPAPIPTISTWIIVMTLIDAPYNASNHRKFKQLYTERAKNAEHLSRELKEIRVHFDELNHFSRGLEDELTRRDAIGAPEARKLLDEQRRALAIQESAMKETMKAIDKQNQMMIRNQEILDGIRQSQRFETEKWNQMKEMIEVLMDGHARRNENTRAQAMEDARRVNQEVIENNRSVQGMLSDLLSDIARLPRHQTISVADSVMVSDSKGTITLPDLPTNIADSWVRALEEDMQ